MKNNTIEIIDGIMGSGKTTGIIKWMNRNPQYKYMYISPLLTEVNERIPVECEGLDFESPNTNNHRTKADHLKDLLAEGSNVSFTHSLFTSLTEEHLYLINREGYILIIDEEIDFIDQYQGKDYKREDIITLEKSGHIEVLEDQLGRVKWTWDTDKFEDGSNYAKLKRMCDLEMLHCAKRDRGMVVVHLPIALLHASKRTIVMTYMFDGSVMSRFMEMKGVNVKYFSELDFIKTEAQVKVEACSLIEMVDTPSTRKVGNVSSKRLTASWYKNSATKDDLNALERALNSICRKYKKDQVLYTLPKHIVLPAHGKASVKVRGYPATECFLYAGTRATNLYSNRTVMIHAFNRYPLLSVSSYLQDYGFPVDPDHFALTEMIQWIWRSAIREGNPIKLCIIPIRMRRLFDKWLDGEY
jgi:hypothetical protein